MRILGVDPGSIRCGWAIVARVGSRITYVGSGVIRPAAQSPLAERLHVIDLSIRQHGKGADLAYVEDVYIRRDVSSARSSLIIGAARGVVLAALWACGIKPRSITAAEAKRLSCGSGRATKHQVRAAMAAWIDANGRTDVRWHRFTTPSLPQDEADALAIAIAGARRVRT